MILGEIRTENCPCSKYHECDRTIYINWLSEDSWPTSNRINSFWQMLSRLFKSLGPSLRFADIGWFIGALRMSYHEYSSRMFTYAVPSPFSTNIPSRTSETPLSPQQRLRTRVELLDDLSWGFCSSDPYILQTNFASTMLGRQVRKLFAFKESSVCRGMSPANKESMSALSWMQRHLLLSHAILWRLVGGIEHFQLMSPVLTYYLALRCGTQFILVPLPLLLWLSLLHLVSYPLLAPGWSMRKSLI